MPRQMYGLMKPMLIRTGPQHHNQQIHIRLAIPRGQTEPRGDRRPCLYSRVAFVQESVGVLPEELAGPALFVGDAARVHFFVDESDEDGVLQGVTD
jgi:hypothetical protein